MTGLTRVGGFLASIAVDAVVAFDLITRPDKAPVTVVGDIISREALLFGIAVFATGTAIAFAWPAVVWVWTVPERTLERKQQREAARTGGRDLTPRNSPEN